MTSLTTAAAVSLLYEIHKNDDFRIFGDRMYCNGREVIIRLNGSDSIWLQI